MRIALHPPRTRIAQTSTLSVAACKPFLAFSRANRKYRRAQSDNFTLQGSTVTNAVSVYPSTAKATATVTTFTAPEMPACLKQLFETSYRRQLKDDPKTAKTVTSVKTSINAVPNVRIGDQSVAYQGRVDIGLTDGTTHTQGRSDESVALHVVPGLEDAFDRGGAPCLQERIGHRPEDVGQLALGP